MATEQPKPAPTPQEPQYTTVPYPHLGQYPHAPPGHYPYLPFPPPDGPASENPPNGAPPGFMMFHPPGMMYYPGPQTQPYSPPQNTSAQSALRPKRRQVKMACTNCANACKRCDERRPCERCVKYNIAEGCVDGQRKERKKGIKRGPYKRKNKTSDSPTFSATVEPPAVDNNEHWNSAPPPAPSTATTAAAIQAVSQFVPGEGFYPLFYPPPPGFLPGPSPHDGPPGAEHTNGGPPPLTYFLPGPYPPYSYPGFIHGPPPPHAMPAPVTAQQPSATPPASGTGAAPTPVPASTPAPQPADAAKAVNGNGVPPPITALAHPIAPIVETKKRARPAKNGGEGKTKKAKRAAAAAKIKEDEANAAEEGAVAAAVIAEVE